MPNHHTLFVREVPRERMIDPIALDSPILWGVFDEFGAVHASSFDKFALYQWAAENDVTFATIH